MLRILPKSLLLILLLAVLSISFATNAFALTPSLPTYNYTHINDISSSSDTTYISSTATDNSGNLYITGSFEGTVNFNTLGGTDEKTSIGGTDIFLTKINSDGTYGYTYTFAGNDYDWANDVTTDSSGKIYIVGSFWSTVDFDPTDLGTDNHTAVSYNDSFLTIINVDGTYDGSYTWGGNLANGEASSVRVDSANNIYIGGIFNETVDFDHSGGTTNRTSNGGWDIYLLKLRANKSFDFVYTVGGVNEDHLTYMDMDSDSNIYYSGYYRDNTLDLDPTSGTDEHSTSSHTNGFITKINDDDSYGFSYVLGEEIYSKVFAVAVDSKHNVYFGGEYTGTVNFNTQGGTDEYTSVGSSDAFLTKLNADGSYERTYSWGGNNDEVTLSIDVDQYDNIYAVGSMKSSSADLNPTKRVDTKTTTTAGSSSLFLLRINSNETYGYSGVITGADDSEAYSIGTGDTGTQHILRIDQFNNMYLGGRVSGFINFNPFGSDPITLDYPTANHAFLTKFLIPDDPTSGENTSDKKSSKKCEHRTPPQTSRIILKPITVDGIRGIMVDWIQYDADLVNIKIDDGTNTYPWKLDRTANDGHEFLPNVATSQKIAIQPVNHCKTGPTSEGISYITNKKGWLN